MAKKAKTGTPNIPALRAHFIPNSHLDREWTLEYQQTRRLTVEFLDALLDIFDQVPEYTFLLDSQTVPLEDYLEIRPENEARVRAAVHSGRMSIGPWYTAPDDNTISGESIVRNLLVGDRLARKYGKPMKVGYTPFGFGQVSQLPQIYQGFGIDTVLFYRGISGQKEAEFLWESPDGTESLCSRFGTKARYNFFMDVWRPVAYGRAFTDRIFAWNDCTVPFKRINAEREYDHFFVLQPKKELHRDVLEQSFRKLIEVESELFTTPAIPMMQGMDTTKPDPLEAEIVRELQGLLKDGEELFFSTMEQYMDDVKSMIDRKKLKKYTGEMRHAGPPSPFVSNLEHIVSSRVRQKIAHSKSERALIRMAEPMAALSWALLDQRYPKTYLDLAWKYLLHCHPHDTVAGCGIDKVERDAMYRLDQVQAISDIVLDDALGALLLRIDTSRVKENEIVLTIFNPTPRPRTEVVDCYVDIPHNTGIVDFEVVDLDGNVPDYTFVYREPTEKTVRDNSDLTMALVGWMCKIQLRAENVPPMGYQTYVVRNAPATGRRERIASSAHRMENDYLVVEINSDGTIDVTDKKTKRSYRKLHSFIDEGENGNNWEHRAPGIDRKISSIGSPCEISIEENTPLSATVRTRIVMHVPSGIIHNDTYHYARRGDLTEQVVLTSFFTLRKGSRRLDVMTEVENNAKSHRLRMLFPTNLTAAKTSYAETAYDVVERGIDRDDKHSYAQAPNPNHPLNRFVGVSDGKAGLAIITEGLHEYEVTDDPSRTISLTVLRAMLVTLCTVSWRWERRPDQELAQMLGKYTVRYAILPHDGDWEKGEVMREAEDFHLPLIPGQSSRNEGGSLPARGALLEVSPAELLVSAVKKAEDRDTLVVRVFNSATKPVQGKITFPREVASVRLLNMNEDPMEGPAPKADGHVITTKVTQKKVQTLEVTLKSAEMKTKRGKK